MPTEAGCCGSGFVVPKRSNRKTKFKGSVIASHAGILWTIWWDNIAKCSSCKAAILEVESCALPSVELKKEKFKKVPDNLLVNDPHLELVQVTPAALCGKGGQQSREGAGVGQLGKQAAPGMKSGGQNRGVLLSKSPHQQDQQKTKTPNDPSSVDVFLDTSTEGKPSSPHMWRSHPVPLPSCFVTPALWLHFTQNLPC